MPISVASLRSWVSEGGQNVPGISGSVWLASGCVYVYPCLIFLWGEEDTWKSWDRDNEQLTRNSAFYQASHLQSLLTGPQVPSVLLTDLLKVLGQVSLLPQDVC